jgi:hypothetical protein
MQQSDKINQMMANAMEPKPRIPLYRLTQSSNEMYFKKMQKLHDKINKNKQVDVPSQNESLPKFKGWVEITKETLAPAVFA